MRGQQTDRRITEQTFLLPRYRRLFDFLLEFILMVMGKAAQPFAILSSGLLEVNRNIPF